MEQIISIFQESEMLPLISLFSFIVSLLIWWLYLRGSKWLAVLVFLLFGFFFYVLSLGLSSCCICDGYSVIINLVGYITIVLFVGITAVSWREYRTKDHFPNKAKIVSAGVGIFAFLISSAYITSVLYEKCMASGPRDGRRASEVARIEHALELYYQDNREYPTSIGVLINENYVDYPPFLLDPVGDEAYNYAYGIGKKTDTIQYYHLGAVLEHANSDLLSQDADYNSTTDTDQVDWRPDSENPGPCLGANGFNGADDNNCGLSDRAGVYDRGVFPE